MKNILLISAALILATAVGVLSTLLVLSLNGAEQTSTVEVPMEVGVYPNKNWDEMLPCRDGDAVPDTETAIRVAKAFWGEEKFFEGEDALIPKSVFFDSEDEIWIVTFKSNDPSFSDCTSVAIAKSDGRVFCIFDEE